MEVGILAMAALRYGHTPVPLFIALLIHTATRVISADGVVSADILPVDASTIGRMQPECQLDAMLLA